MSWLQLHFHTTSNNAEALSELLESNGALSVTLRDAGDQPIYEPDVKTPLWDELIVTALFAEAHDTQYVLAKVLSAFPTMTYQHETLADQEWERAWMDDFKPMAFGKRLWIIPSHLAGQCSPFEVILDPGLAFGTGRHPTTALCLQWLDQHIRGGETLLDYGCGSGILGIAALKLGAHQLIAVDHDPQAITATLQNAERNHIEPERLIALLPEALSVNYRPNLLLANILANPLITLAPRFTELLETHADLVLSGILVDQADSVIKAYEKHFKVMKIADQEGWVRIDAVRK